MIKIANIVGARPQFIKYFPVAEAIKNYNSNNGSVIKDMLIHTGQHYDYSMSKVFFDDFGIREPDYHLGIGSGNHGEQTGRIIQKVEEVFSTERPDIVLVYGDTNSTLGGALASAKLHIPVVHIEAGLRSFNKYMPEEINRILTDHISTLLFCPSKTAIRNLINEGFSNILNDGETISLNHPVQQSKELSSIKADKNNPAVVNIGDVMYDVLQFSIKIADKKSKILEQLHLAPKNYYILTLHRAENTDNPERLEKVIAFANDFAKDKAIIFPMHPRTRKIYENARVKLDKNVNIIEPLGYFDILMLLKNSLLVMTDSGGMQKEAYWLRVPCITLRDETEWVETVQSGWNILYQNYKGKHEPTEDAPSLYGDGRASKHIVDCVESFFK